MTIMEMMHEVFVVVIANSSHHHPLINSSSSNIVHQADREDVPMGIIWTGVTGRIVMLGVYAVATRSNHHLGSSSSVQ